jgi:hypothetical protein
MSLTVGSILKVVCTMAHADGNLVQNVFHTLITAGAGPHDAEDVSDDMADWIDDMFGTLSTYLSDELTATEVTVYEYDSTNDDWDEVGTGVPTHAPSQTSDIMPRGTAALLNAKSSDPDVNGKKYLGVFTAGHWVNGAWAAGLLTALISFSGQWYNPHVGAATGATFESGIWSPTNTTFYPLTGTFSTATFPAYQRRRKPGVGS